MARTTIPAELVAVNAIQGTLIADNAVTSVHIAQNNVTTVQIATNNITSEAIAQNNVTSVHILQNTITATHLADSAVENAKIGADAVTGAKLADNAVDSEHYTDGSIDTAHLGDLQVTASQDRANAVTLAKMASLARGSILIGNSAADVAALAIGSNGTVLKSDGTDITWGADTDNFLPLAGGTMTGALTGTTATLSGALGVGAGSVSAPSLSFAGDTNTGIYNGAADNMYFAIGGALKGFWSGSQFNVTGNGIFSGNGTFGGTLGVTGAITASAGLTVAGSNLIYFRDAQIYIRSSADGDLNIVADDEIDLTSTLIDINGNADVSGTLGVTGASSLSTVLIDGVSNYTGLEVKGSGGARPQVKFTNANNGVLGSIYGTEGNALVITSGTGGATAMTLNSSQQVLVGLDTINTNTAKMQVNASTTNKYAFTVSHQGDATHRFGMQIMAGTDDNSGTNTMIGFTDGDFSPIGTVTSSGGTVTYGAFTAMHPCIIPNADNDSSSGDNAYPYGTLLETVSLSYTQKNGANTERGLLYNVQKSQSANSKKVLGAYGSSVNGGPENETNMHQALILGDGHIICNNSGGNIEVGDGICTSAVEGIGMKATVNPSLVIGIAQENVTFSGSETKLVAVQYGLEQFTPWS